jgi:hypothetical protein
LEYCHRSEKEYDANPPPVVYRLRKIKAELGLYPPEERHAALQRILARERAEEAERSRPQPAEGT